MKFLLVNKFNNFAYGSQIGKQLTLIVYIYTRYLL